MLWFGVFMVIFGLVSWFTAGRVPSGLNTKMGRALQRIGFAENSEGYYARQSRIVGAGAFVFGVIFIVTSLV